VGGAKCCVLQYVAVCCSAVCCHVLQCFALLEYRRGGGGEMQCVVVCVVVFRSVLKCVADVSYRMGAWKSSVLQCVALCCSLKV